MNFCGYKITSQRAGGVIQNIQGHKKILKFGHWGVIRNIVYDRYL